MSSRIGSAVNMAFPFGDIASEGCW